MEKIPRSNKWTTDVTFNYGPDEKYLQFSPKSGDNGEWNSGEGDFSWLRPQNRQFFIRLPRLMLLLRVFVTGLDNGCCD
jgi:hypothetical protein